jgi:hypothetical protein
MASKLTLWRKIGRFVTGLVVVCFFLPFFGVSCKGFDVVTMSGTDMVAGCKPGGALAEGEGMANDIGGGDGESKVPSVDVEPLAIIAFACAVIGFGLAWVKSRGALIGTLVVSIAGLGALGGLYFKVKSNLDDAVKSELDKDDKGGDDERPASTASKKMMEEMDLDVGGRLGLWLTALLLVSVITLTGLALKEKEGLGGIGVAGYPPQGPPPGYPPQGPPPG